MEVKSTYKEPNWFKSVNDPEYFKGMKSKERQDTYKHIFGLGVQQFEADMKPHLRKGFEAWCKKNNKACDLTPAKVEVKGRKDMSGADMAQYDLAVQRKNRKMIEYYETLYPALKSKNS